MIKGLIAPSVVLQTDQEMMEPYKHLPSDVGNDREKTPNRHFPLPSSLSLSLAIFCFSLFLSHSLLALYSLMFSS